MVFSNRSKFWDHSVTSYTISNTTDPNFGYEVENTNVQVLLNQPCHIVFGGSSKTNEQDIIKNQIDYNSRLYIYNENASQIKTGDELHITTYGITRIYYAGESFNYAQHAVINLYINRQA